MMMMQMMGNQGGMPSNQFRGGQGGPKPNYGATNQQA
jgi:hypothetical protein